MIWFWILLGYTAVAGACIFGFLVAAEICTDFDPDTDATLFVVCGILWPLTLLPVTGYLAAGWYLNNRNH